MRQDSGRLLQPGLIHGKHPRSIAKGLKKYRYGNDPKTGGLCYLLRGTTNTIRNGGMNLSTNHFKTVFHVVFLLS